MDNLSGCLFHHLKSIKNSTESSPCIENFLMPLFAFTSIICNTSHGLFSLLVKTFTLVIAFITKKVGMLISLSSFCTLQYHSKSTFAQDFWVLTPLPPCFICLCLFWSTPSPQGMFVLARTQPLPLNFHPCEN